jgi:hypothetical protein
MAVKLYIFESNSLDKREGEVFNLEGELENRRSGSGGSAGGFHIHCR